MLYSMNKTIKETIKFTGLLLIVFIINACNNHNGMADMQKKQQFTDSVTEARIDSFYKITLAECDTLKKYKVPQLAQLLLQKDTAAFQRFNDSLCFFRDSVAKVQKVVQQLKLECDSNLIKETFALTQQLKQAKPKQPTKKKP